MPAGGAAGAAGAATGDVSYAGFESSVEREPKRESRNAPVPIDDSAIVRSTPRRPKKSAASRTDSATDSTAAAPKNTATNKAPTASGAPSAVTSVIGRRISLQPRTEPAISCPRNDVIVKIGGKRIASGIPITVTNSNTVATSISGHARIPTTSDSAVR